MIEKLQNGIVFLSMPYSSKLETEDERILEKQERFEKSLKLLSYLQLNRIHVVSPITQGHPVVIKYEVPSDWEYWEEYCHKFISISDCVLIFAIDGYDVSTGVAGEIKYAKEIGKPIYIIDENLNLKLYANI